jgi:hypothetical protein
VVIYAYFPRSGTLCHEKSGNPAPNKKKADARLPWLRQLIDLSSLSHYALHLLLQFDRSLASPSSYLQHLKVTR